MGRETKQHSLVGARGIRCEVGQCVTATRELSWGDGQHQSRRQNKSREQGRVNQLRENKLHISQMSTKDISSKPPPGSFLTLATWLVVPIWLPLKTRHQPSSFTYKVNFGQMLTVIITAFLKTVNNHSGCHLKLHSEGTSLCQWIVVCLGATSDLLGLPSVDRQGQSHFCPQNRQKPGQSHMWDTRLPPIHSAVLMCKFYSSLMEKEEILESEPGL